MTITHRAMPLNGNANLNFDIVGGTSLPTKVKPNTIWVNTENPIHYWSLNGKEPYKKSNNKNLLTYPYIDTTKTITGITFTDNRDGSITINGTAAAETAFILCRFQLDKGKTYTLKGTGITGASIHVAEYTKNAWIHTPHVCEANDVTFNYAGLQTSNAFMQCVLIIKAGASFNNYVIYPQLEKGTSSTSFVKGDATGRIWLPTLNSGGTVSFNAFKQNNLRENLSRLRQWSSQYGWEYKNAYIYQNEQWTQFSQEADIHLVENGVFDTTRISSFDNGLILHLSTGGDRDSGMTASKTTTAGNIIDLSMFAGIKIKGIAKAGASSHGGCSSSGTLILNTSSGNYDIAVSFAQSGGSVPSSSEVPFEKTIPANFSMSEQLSFTANFVFSRWAGASNGGVEFQITDIYLLKDYNAAPPKDYPLYTYGVQNVEWTGVGGGYGSGSTTFGYSVALSATGSYGNGGRYQSMYTKNKIDLTEYTKLKVVVSGYAYGHEGLVLDGMREDNGFFRMGITDGVDCNIKNNAYSNTININPTVETSDAREVVMDISGITGKYYIGICMMAYRLYDYSNSGYVYSVSLHKD